MKLVIFRALVIKSKTLSLLLVTPLPSIVSSKGGGGGGGGGGVGHMGLRTINLSLVDPFQAYIHEDINL